MKISRFGNIHSEILDSLVDNANKKSPNTPVETDFTKIASSILNKTTKPTLKEVLAQFEMIEDDVVDADPTGMDSPAPVDDVGGDLPTDDVGGGGGEDVKQKLVEALLAACGGDIEGVKSAVDQFGGGVDEEMPGAPVDEEIPGEAGMTDPGAELGAPANDMPAPASPMEMPAPMEMPY